MRLLAYGLLDAREKVVEDFFSYFRSLAEERRDHPTDDLATLIANAVVDGQPIRELPMLGYYVIVATAGHDTTSSALAGAMHLLSPHPDDLARIQAEPPLLTNAIEEMLRRTAPVRHFMRTVAEPTEVAGQEVAAGDRIYLSYKAANLDPKVFAHYARNWRTGAAMPPALVDKIKKSASFDRGYTIGETLAAAEAAPRTQGFLKICERTRAANHESGINRRTKSSGAAFFPTG